jgi:hypothetical protein
MSALSQAGEQKTSSGIFDRNLALPNSWVVPPDVNNKGSDNAYRTYPIRKANFDVSSH